MHPFPLRNRTSGWFLVTRISTFILLALSLSSCALMYRDLQPPTMELTGIQAGSIKNNLSLALIAQLQVSNPNDVPLPVNGGKFNITLNGQKISDSLVFDGFDIPPNGTANVGVSVNINLLQAFAFGLDLMNNNNPEIDWHLNGYIDVGVKYLGRVFINESGSVNLGDTINNIANN